MITSTMNNRMFQKPSTGVNTKDFKSRLGNFNNNASYQNFQKNESATKFLGAAIEFLSEPHNKVRYSLVVAHYLMGLKKYDDLPTELKKQVSDISASFKTGYFNGSILSDILNSGTKEYKAASSYFNGITNQNCEKTFEKLQLLYFNQELCLSIDEETVTRIVTQAYSSLSSPSPKVSEEDIMTIKIYIQKQKLGQVGSGKVSQTDVLDVLLKFIPKSAFAPIVHQKNIETLMKLIYPGKVKQKVLQDLAAHTDIAIINNRPAKPTKVPLKWNDEAKPRPGNNVDSGICQANTYLEFQKQILKIEPDTMKKVIQSDGVKLLANVQPSSSRKKYQTSARNKIAQNYDSYTASQIEFLNKRNYYCTESVIFEAGGFTETIKQIITNNLSQLLEHNPILIDLGYANGFSYDGHSISLIINLKSIGNKNFYHISYYDSNEARNKVLRIPVKNLAQSDFLCPISTEYEKNQFVAKIYTKQPQKPDKIIGHTNVHINTVENPSSLFYLSSKERAEYLQTIKKSWRLLKSGNLEYFIELMQDLGVLLVITKDQELINEYLSFLNEIPGKAQILDVYSNVYNCTLKALFKQNGYQI